jgi:hypothetical protein
LALIRWSPLGASAATSGTSRPGASNSFLGPVAAQPLLEQGAVRGVGAGLRHGHLVRAEGALDPDAVDVIASLIDAGSQHGSARRLLLGGAAVSAVALGVAAAGASPMSSWSSACGPRLPVRRSSWSLSGVVRSSATSGRCWPRVVWGVVFIVAAAGEHPTLMMLLPYAAAGGVVSSYRPGCSRGGIAARPPRQARSRAQADRRLDPERCKRGPCGNGPVRQTPPAWRSPGRTANIENGLVGCTELVR